MAVKGCVPDNGDGEVVLACREVRELEIPLESAIL